MSRILTFALAAFSLVALALPAEARRGSDDRGSHHSSGHHGNTGVSRANATVSSDRAVEIARGQGMARLHEVKFRDGAWKVEGPMANGQWLEIYVHPTSGEVLSREVYAAHR